MKNVSCEFSVFRVLIGIKDTGELVDTRDDQVVDIDESYAVVLSNMFNHSGDGPVSHPHVNAAGHVFPNQPVLRPIDQN